ncbi:MAG: hypothetical protein HY619_05565 [Thaumarchaeota archaeon]|nr:hypothetical protein [Nitrososphaerota archaeon]
MSDIVKSALLVVIGVVLAAFLNGGIYQIVGASVGGAEPNYRAPIWGYRLNRFTGEVMAISGAEAMIRVPVNERISKRVQERASEKSN